MSLIKYTNSLIKLDQLMEFIEYKLKSPERVAQEIEHKKMMESRRRIDNTLKLVQKFIHKNKGIVYGGFALNALLPDELKFYDSTEIPDYDFFILDAASESKKLADKLVKKGFKYTEVKHALHEGTYKVFSNFESVADMTDLTFSEYKILKDNAITKRIGYSKKILIAPIDFLKGAAYLELCLPIGSSFRWTKVYKRLLLFEQAYPLPAISEKNVEMILKENVLSNEFKSLYQEVKKYIKLNELVYVNLQAIKFYLGSDADDLKSILNHLQILSVEPNLTIKDITSKIRAYNLDYEVKRFDSYKAFVPIKHVIYIKNKNNTTKKSNEYEKFISIYDAREHCFAYMKKRGSLYCSIYFLFYIYYFKELIEKNQHKEYSSNQIILSRLQNILMDDDKHSNLIKSFTDECYGKENTISSIKKSIWENNKKILYYRP